MTADVSGRILGPLIRFVELLVLGVTSVGSPHAAFDILSLAGRRSQQTFQKRHVTFGKRNDLYSDTAFDRREYRRQKK